ncbi:MAG: peptidylprolyl isomerase [Candidatus Thorarchaeota archaeon]
MIVRKGHRVKVEYIGILEDGTIITNTAVHSEPFEFYIGEGRLPKGLENAILGMEVGEEKVIQLQPSEAFGDPKPELIRKVTRGQLPRNADLRPGMKIVVGKPNGGGEKEARVLGVKDNTVFLDFNHPLAGKKVNFRVKVIDIGA